LVIAPLRRSHAYSSPNPFLQYDFVDPRELKREQNFAFDFDLYSKLIFLSLLTATLETKRVKVRPSPRLLEM
jgi:hypothetical protein